MTEIAGAPVEEAAGRWRLTRRADVVAALADDRLEVPAATPADVPGGTHGPMAVFRGSVSRFSNGPPHARRRAEVERALAQVRPAALRDRARERMSAVLARAGGDSDRNDRNDRNDGIDLMPALRTVPVEVLAEALGVTAERSGLVARQVALVAPAYPPGAPPDAVAVADAAVRELAGLLGDDRLATVGCLLVQACDATAALAGVSLAALGTLPVGGRPAAEAALATTLRHDPPVRATARVAKADVVVGGRRIPAGSTVVLDLAAATHDRDGRVAEGGQADRGDQTDRSDRSDRGDRSGPDRQAHDGDAPARHVPDGRALTFGGGPRPCPGDRHALALAAGVVDAASRCEVVDVAYGPAGNIRIPTRLVVRV